MFSVFFVLLELFFWNGAVEDVAFVYLSADGDAGQASGDLFAFVGGVDVFLFELYAFDGCEFFSFFVEERGA